MELSENDDFFVFWKVFTNAKRSNEADNRRESNKGREGKDGSFFPKKKKARDTICVPVMRVKVILFFISSPLQAKASFQSSTIGSSILVFKRHY